MDVETEITQEIVVIDVYAFSYPGSAEIIYCG